jgi:hypothetical protein
MPPFKSSPDSGKKPTTGGGKRSTVGHKASGKKAAGVPGGMGGNKRGK